MRVLAPFTRRHIRAVTALGATGRSWQSAWVGGSDIDYYALLASVWAAGESFCLVEHDVVVTPTALSELEACESDWCAFQTPYRAGAGGVHAGLGCVKFSAALLARVPDAMRDVARMSDPVHPPMHWCRLDHWLQTVALPGARERMCVHGPPLEHLRDHDGPPTPSHGCC